MNNKWSRRSFTKAVISAQALIATGALTLPVACAETKKTEGDAPLDSQQQKTLKYAMDEIIPANEKMPSASEIGGVGYVLNILEELLELTPLFISLTDKIEAHSLQHFSSDFSTLNKDNRIAVLTNMEQSEPELFKVLKDFTYESYYTNKEVYELIKYEPHTTGTFGPEMTPFDEKLLDRVKTGPPTYTKI
ncbi:gluconate 2-dehydrogenase subunit 3 family protein [Muriicola sp. Z0-33]|uniref:gluconate 2-dehydrogenase subunit 3 family protein n=1 Tax=Muriicola sp. Z0-33 TaxID=2816957 RepID=UPI002238CD28|nr:gluconate 2-dehydrogenase subunit 3 family protein [Muriicola sp. Z0-33]MCW5516029.1 gluconate 2-dehydrogenase subunit 3 family protein [Muriicola sp. Z0-33]